MGSKNAQLGEISTRLGLPVPGGFAITAWAYKQFIDHNDLQRRIDQCIEMVDFKRYDDLIWISEKIQSLVLASKMPPELEQALAPRLVRVEVIEPGVVRQALLQNRLIRDEGLTTTQIYDKRRRATYESASHMIPI